METSFYREPNKSENINPNKTLSGPTAQRREPWETRCLFTHDGTGGGQHSDNSLRDRRPAASPGSSLEAVTTKYWGLTSKRRRHGAIYPGTVWRVVTWQSRGTNWVYWLRSRDHRGARPQQLTPPPHQRACWRGRCAAGSVHSHQQQHAATERGTIISRAGGRLVADAIYYKPAALPSTLYAVRRFLNDVYKVFKPITKKICWMLKINLAYINKVKSFLRDL